ncbi:MAG: UDP-N-acetylmuramoyl-L-alanyl-D-glutamate--2,6-diaminopimelate ligase [Clostridiales bacterium]|nr:UDP-N-acetylmuramoyl-L-alanyl-D-glutamate--2,6-diaminopimelate ligase [Clostridiales bacterium]
MKASDLLSEVKYKTLTGDLSVSIQKVVLDSREAVPGTAFVAICGQCVDGHQYVEKAAEKGASLIVTDEDRALLSDDELVEIGKKYNTAVVVVKNTRLVYSQIACTYFSHPSKEMSLIGITGTKGKTTSTYIVHEIFQSSGRPCGLIGSIENKIGRESEFSHHTTPEAWEFQELLSKMKEKDVNHCVMEVSSLGLKFLRTYGAKFRVGVFTNLFLDHISPQEHETEDEYFQCKLMLFDQCEIALVNKETRRLSEIVDYARAHTGSCYTYSICGDADFMAKDIRPDIKGQTPGMSFTFVTPTYETELFVPLLCDFNVDNALCASASAYLCGVPEEEIRKGLSQVYVPGRMEKVHNNLGLQVFVDYAHNGDSLRVLLQALRHSCRGRIITLFGCGGNRSKTRRLTMGEMSARYSDFSVVTADNSRQEEFSEIVELIEEGIHRVPDAKYCIIEDRRKAIEYAIDMATPDDYVVIAGKGHERTMEMKNGIIDFVDADEASAALSELEEARKAEEKK